MPRRTGAFGYGYLWWVFDNPDLPDVYEGAFFTGLGAVGQQAYNTLEALSTVAASASASLDDAPASVAAIADQLREAEKAGKRIADELAGYRARSPYDAASGSEDGLRWIEQTANGADFDDARAIAHTLASLPGAVYVAISEDPPRILLATSEDCGIEAGTVLKRCLAEVGGRGGGSARIPQGSASDAQSVRRLVERIRAELG